MKILVVGSGGREHALAWKLAQSPKVEHVYVAPGNAGTAMENKMSNVGIATDDIPTLIKFAKDKSIAYTVVGPEQPLANGIVNDFLRAGLLCLGPSKAAAQIESSKSFCKAFMQRHRIPTARYQVFTETQDAITFANQLGYPCVIKADGLAAGKGVVIAQTEQQAKQAINNMLNRYQFGVAGTTIVVEEFIRGIEASFIVLTDGKHVVPLATSQDHKARDEGDKGPNTGGMGAYSPAPMVTAELHDKIMQQVITPTINGMAKENLPYTGFLYAGIMITEQGEINVLEFNCRFGDPETQPILFRLKSDLANLCWQAVNHQLEQRPLDWDPQPAIGVVMASGGYPGKYENGKLIQGLTSITDVDCKVFHAGTEANADGVFTKGGRVLCVTAKAKDLAAAQAKAYANVDKITWTDVYYRKDIGYRGIQCNEDS